MARKARDPLRAKLEQLAKTIADEANGSNELSFTQRVAALKVAGAYWALSRKTEPDKSENAWDGYRARIHANGGVIAATLDDDDGAEDLA